MRRGSSCVSTRRGGKPKQKVPVRPGPPGLQVRLRGQQRNRLRRWARKCRDPELRRRIHTVLLRARGWTYSLIASSQHCVVSTVSRTLARWRECGEAGLIDWRADNGNRMVDEDYLGCLAQVLERTAPEYGWPRPTWTREMLIETVRRKTRVRISPATMSRALQTIGARQGRPKPVVLCPWTKHKRSRRLNQIRALASRVARKEVVLYADEVDIHLNPKIGADWMLPGRQRHVVTPGQNKKRYLAGAWDPIQKEMTYVEGERKRSQLFIELCKRLLVVYPNQRRIHLVVDNCIIHSSKITRQALAGLEGRVVLHFLPPYCPDENKIEIRWKHLHDNVTRNHRYKTIGGLMSAVRRYLEPMTRKAPARVAAKKRHAA